MPQAIYDYHYGMEAEQYAFFRIPKVLMTEPHFRGISTDAKLLYGLMLERMSLSVKNGWLDDNERVPKGLAIVKINQRMVNDCDYLIAYAWHHLGGSGQIVEYARNREARGLIVVENLARLEKPDAP